MAYSSEIARMYWNEQQADAAPTYEHLADRVVGKSRKAHQCAACKGSIAKGSSYRTSVFILDGDFIVEKYHRHQCVGGW